MPRYFFEITYNGSNYAGWQSQANALGVQTVVEDALTKLLRTPTKIIGSGRTDTGVHCVQQFFHADIEKLFTKENLIHRLNSFLPRDIAIRSVRKVKPDASARYDAVERTYAYHITTVKDPLLLGLALHYFKPLNIQTMNQAAALLCGEHDFTCFSKVKTDVNHFICRVKKASWKQGGTKLVFTITANRFLRGMVRAIVGTLLDVGTGKISVKDVERIIKSKDRRKAGANVDPHGLYLVSVKYPRSVFID
ncbi:MAG: tRNA pseudouridine(38-40) synthase TruA [Cyclobacteriaceae bacterium]|nr:tRNA pseudouridine(38-40) synthase TruA [Cyclobacteriaceae bacterium]